MTLKISSNKLNPARNFFVFSLKKQTGFVLLMTLFSLLVCPGAVIKAIFEHVESAGLMDSYDMADAFSFCAVCVLIIAFAVMLLLFILNYDFLYVKKASDVFHALPLTRNELLFTRFFSVFIGAAIPFTLSFVSLAIFALLPITAGVTVLSVVKVYLLFLLFLFMCTAFTLIFTVSAGGIFDFILSVGVLNLGIPAVFLICTAWLSESAPGVTIENAYLCRFSPFAYSAYKALFYVSGLSGDRVLDAAIERISVFSVVGCIAFTVLSLLIAAKLFRKRRSETAGEAYSFRYMPNTIAILVSAVGGFLIGLIFSGEFQSFSFWVFFAAGALLCAVAVGAVMSRSFKTVRSSLVKGGIACGLMIALCLTVLCCGSVSSRKIPEIQDIKHITVEESWDNQTEFEANFDAVLDIHKAAVEQIRRCGTETGYGTEDGKSSAMLNPIRYFTISYVLNSGRTIKRTYSLLGNGYDSLLFHYMQSEEYLSGIKADLSAKTVSLNMGAVQSEESGWALINGTVAEKLLSSYREELRAADESVLAEDCIWLSMYYENSLQQTVSKTVYIPESFTKTIDILMSLEFEK